MRAARTLSARLMLVFLGAACGARPTPAQGPSGRAASSLDPATRTRVIEAVLSELNRTYVFPGVARKMEDAIRQRMRSGEYDGVREGERLARKLTDDLREISRDKHLELSYSPTETPAYHASEPTAAEKERRRAAYRRRGEAANWGFEKVEGLSGNVGYLDLRLFADPEFTGDTLVCAMGLLANTDALIIDLRKNGGGEPAMVALVCSYFFSGEPVHLGDLYWRPDETTQQYWTLPYVPGKRYVGKDVYVLTSGETVSAAEALAYGLKSRGRATIVGEVTGGYAHPGSNVRIDAHFSVVVPQGRTINAVTKTDWEGTGVAPDIEVPAARALGTAHLRALERALGREEDEGRKGPLKEAVEAARKGLDERKD